MAAAGPLDQFDAWFKTAASCGLKEPNAMALATADGSPSVRYVLLKGYDERGFVWYTNYDSFKVGGWVHGVGRAAPNDFVIRMHQSMHASGAPLRASITLFKARSTPVACLQGKQLDENPRAALAFWWEPLQRQVGGAGQAGQIILRVIACVLLLPDFTLPLSLPLSQLKFHSFAHVCPPLRCQQVRVEGVVEKVPEEESDAYFSSRPRASQVGALVSMQSVPLRHGRRELEDRAERLERQYADESVPVSAGVDVGG
jgi:pyridoxine/pyridoxamine 5'-phosphate oxidase